jgi:hypothetical protein
MTPDVNVLVAASRRRVTITCITPLQGHGSKARWQPRRMVQRSH